MATTEQLQQNIAHQVVQTLDDILMGRKKLVIRTTIHHELNDANTNYGKPVALETTFHVEDNKHD